ncbi:MAG TPA: 3-oxoadipyl-CoA thiolase, partial [Alphaproteobacteria bacterium]|nr:3-oxoadipyl-CoA thiolase [Alphaproteobacteria bacterium]
MTEAFLLDGIRTPIGRYGGALSGVRPDDLAAHVIKALMDRHPDRDPDLIDEVILGCANQAGEDNRNVARMALLIAGLPQSVPGVTVNRLCASGLEAVAQAARAVKAGEASQVIAGGVESMSRAPFVMGKAESAFDRRAEMFDTTIGWRFVNPKLEAIYGTDAMGETAENLAKEHGILREDQDAFALRSQQLAGASESRLAEQIVAVPVPQRRGEPVSVTKDEHPRPDVSPEDLAKLKPAFRKDGSVTAGNASGVNDGAAALLIGDGTAGEPLARIVSYATAGVAPRTMGIGPVPASEKALRLAG